MPGHKRIDAKKVEQLYVKHTNPAQGGSRTEVRAKLKSRADIRVTKVAYLIEHAQYIEREIETFLGLSDRPVVGEHASGT